jgi:hypothetical protein
MTAGATTPGGAVPTTGTATFNGSAGGVYVDPTGQQFLAAGNATLTTNFATQSTNYSTNGTAAVSVSTGALLPNPSILNMQGTLTPSGSTMTINGNGFGGPVSTSGMNGKAQGYFYGPAANEAGGTFALTGPGVQAYVGAFGATKQ